jgi:hypothetical protein
VKRHVAGGDRLGVARQWLGTVRKRERERERERESRD